MSTETTLFSERPRGHRGPPRGWTTSLETQLGELLLDPFDAVTDVRLLSSNPSRGRMGPKVFIIVEAVDLTLYEQLSRITLQIADLLGDIPLNFDIVPASAAALIPFDAVSVRR